MAEQMVDPKLREIIQRYGAWNLATHNERWARRRTSSEAELKAFYDDMLPLLPDILAACDRFPLGELPAPYDALLNVAISAAEVAPHVELYRGSPKVPNSFEESKFIALRGDRADWCTV
jgi:hypothetical protein